MKMKAKFKPKSTKNYSRILIELCANEKVYNFKYAFTLDNGEKYYEPDDIRFLSSDVINVEDLLEIQ
jgi:hypothetical protein